MQPILKHYLEEEASLAHLVLDQQGRILSTNRYARESISSDLVGKMFADVLVDFSNAFSLEMALSQPGQVHLLNLMQTDGMPQTLYFKFYEEERVIHAFGEVNHIEVDRLRNTLVQANSELSNLARDLQKANAELKKLGELKNRFLGMAAHDMRNPLGAILSFSQFLQEEDCFPPEKRQFIDIIESTSRFMLGLIDDLLDVSRIEAGRLNLECTKTNFPALVKRNLALNRTLAAQKNISIVGQFREPVPPFMYIDSLKIEQVLNNLLSNAIKFSPPESTVAVDLFMSGDKVTVSVRDQGPGISDMDLAHIFEPFGLGTAKPTGDERSTGLGLHIVRRIVLGHGGNLWVESTPGQGASFYFTLDQGQPPD